MSDDFETALREALRREDPGAAFTERTMQRVTRTAPVHNAARGWLARATSSALYRLPRPSAQWLAATVLAGAVAAIGVVHWRSESLAQARGMQARTELLQALSITSETLGAARKLVLRDAEHDS